MRPASLLLFTRYPEPGTTKTRLIPALGPDGAARLQQQLTERIVAEARTLTAHTGIKTIVHYAGGESARLGTWLGPLSFVAQAQTDDLGERMAAAFRHAFASDAERVVLIGSDIPEITADLLEQAFGVLENTSVIIGPSEDGGYYLIGLQKEAGEQLLALLFEDIPWSTGKVFAITQHRLEKAGIAYATTPRLRDIDEPTDLDFARAQGLL